jgi:hypothetical protein
MGFRVWDLGVGVYGRVEVSGLGVGASGRGGKRDEV